VIYFPRSQREYLDGCKPDPGGIPSTEERHRWTMEMVKAEKMSKALEMAEEREEYEAGEEK
jgi:hypothetical protein